ncbi:MAG TPA: D-aminoacyl-tRNA deacylase [Actinomycetota bacterium]|nr:D-aminoacyl-tRNA deacylase [Actinomycetota bacterium]
MRLVVQRVSRAAVRVGGDEVTSIGPGLLVLVGVGHDESDGEVPWLAAKLAHLRIFEDADGKMNRSVLEVGGEVLVVPQFTLYGDVRKGRRPSWADAAAPEVARERVDAFAKALRDEGVPVQEGAFREHLEVELVNDGPVTILLEGRPP